MVLQSCQNFQLRSPLLPSAASKALVTASQTFIPGVPYGCPSSSCCQKAPPSAGYLQLFSNFHTNRHPCTPLQTPVLSFPRQFFPSTVRPIRDKPYSSISPEHSRPKVTCLISSGSSPTQYSVPIISVVIPVFNEVLSIGLLLERVASVLQRRGYTYEILCIDDGSTDGTTRLLKSLAAQRKDLRAIILRRNFGQTAAISAGFDASVGDVVVTLDGDLQNDPDDIPRLVDHLLYGGEGLEGDGRAGGSGTVREDGGFDMVCGWRKERRDDVIRRVPSQVANWLIGKVTGVHLHDCGCSLKAFRADLVSSLRLYGETHRLIPALASIEGAAIAELPVRHHSRSFGSSKYPPLGRTPRVVLDLILVAFLARFRDRPMQLFGFVGCALMLCASGCALNGAFSVWAVARHWGIAIAWPAAVPSFVLAVELAVAGLQMVFLGLLAEICVRMYFETQERAHYNIQEVVSSGSSVR